MSNIAIKVENLSKKYIIGRGQSGSLRETLSNAFHNTFGGKRTDVEEFWALNDVSFEIKQGEAIGIIGRNGAGKSTLLKLLSKITYPTSGKITMNGRVSSLLEVGTGFHPELTGRENIYLNGTILGMSRKEVKSKFDEIVAFSGVEKFLDTPVKRYSSGMYVRLAFAIAAHLEPEILIIDEVLAVGDTEFQKKCLGKMDEVAKEGRTVLFVSHNMGAIQNLCTNCIIIEKGMAKEKMMCTDAVSYYLSQNMTAMQTRALKKEIIEPYILQVNVENSSDSNRETLIINIAIESAIEVKSSVDFGISDKNNTVIGFASVGTFNENDIIDIKKGLNNFRFGIDIKCLAIGLYNLSINLTLPDVKYYDKYENALFFEVLRKPRENNRRVLDQSWNLGSIELASSIIQ